MPLRPLNSDPCCAPVPAREPTNDTSAAARALVALIGLYQVVLRPLAPPSCRFTPSCSTYARDAVRYHGVLRGLRLGAWRVLRCHPYSAGGYDPVPDRLT